MTTIAFIGLGIMGRPMAANLLGAGFDVVAFNRSSSALDRHVEQGGRRAASIAEAVADADFIATMLPDSPDVTAVLAGPDGVFAHARPGAGVIDFSTIALGSAVHLAQEGAARGFDVLDAPVSGGEQGAIEGSLSVMVGGSPDGYAAAAAVFAAVGSTIVHVGPAGAGQTVKAANQLIVAGNLVLVAEALVFLQEHDVDPAAAVKVLAGGLAGSTVLTRKAPAMLARDFKPGFRTELHVKDMGIVLDAARSQGVVLPLGSAAAQLVTSLRAQGGGGLDHSALFTVIEQLAGREPR